MDKEKDNKKVFDSQVNGLLVHSGTFQFNKLLKVPVLVDFESV